MTTTSAVAPLSAGEMDETIKHAEQIVEWLEGVHKNQTAATIKSLIAQARTAQTLSASSVNSLCGAPSAERAQQSGAAAPSDSNSIEFDGIKTAATPQSQVATYTAGVDLEGFVWPTPPARKGQSHVLFDDGYEEGWAKAVETIRAALAQQTAAQPAPAAQAVVQTQAHRAGFGEGVRAAADLVESAGERMIAARVRDLQSRAPIAPAGDAEDARLPIPDGWKLVKVSRLAEITELAEDPSENAYEGRGLYDDRIIRQNWSACVSRLDRIKDHMQAINTKGWDDEDLEADRGAMLANKSEDE